MRVIDIFSKYAGVVPLKDKKILVLLMLFKKYQITDISKALWRGGRRTKSKGRKPNKIWVEKGSEFYNNYFNKWLKDNDIKAYSIHNEGKSVIAEEYIRTLKSKIYK